MFKEITDRQGFPLFFAGSSTSVADDKIDNEGLLRLLSYVNEKGVIEKRCSKGKKTFMDSGAFSAMTRGINIDVADYIDFINTHHKNLLIYCQWDTIPFDKISPEESAKRTWENYLYMRERVLCPEKLLYVFHYGEDWDYLRNALNGKIEIPYIALGGIARRNYKQREEFIKECFKIIKSSKRPNTKVHGFGMTQRKLLEKYPFTSADSTSWAYPGRFGYMMIGPKKIFISKDSIHHDNHYIYMSKEEKEKVAKVVRRKGYLMKELMVNAEKRNYFEIDCTIDWIYSYKYKGKIYKQKNNKLKGLI